MANSDIAGNFSDCWICGDPAGTKEHLVKKSDLAREFGRVSQSRRLFFTSAATSSKPISTTKSKILCFNRKICQTCNSVRSQPYDRPWETLAAAMCARHPKLKPGDVVRADRIFRSDTNASMAKVQLYFVKLMLGIMVEQGEEIDSDALRKSFLAGSPYTYLDLKFGLTANSGIGILSIVDAKLPGRLAAQYEFGGGLAVQILIRDHQTDFQFAGSWSPFSGSNRLDIHDLVEL